MLGGAACAQPAPPYDNDAHTPAPIAFIISYVPAAPRNPPSGVLVVRPPPGRMLIGTTADARVEVRFPFEEPQVLTRMNFGPKAPGDARYVFMVPREFVRGRLSCGPDQPQTVVSVMDAGRTLTREFPLCPGVAVNPDLASQ